MHESTEVSKEVEEALGHCRDVWPKLSKARTAQLVAMRSEVADGCMESSEAWLRS
jgi:hypothetical protein